MQEKIEAILEAFHDEVRDFWIEDIIPPTKELLTWPELLDQATASLLKLLTEARMQVWRDILGAGADNPEDLPDDFISVPAFWIKKQLAELKGEK